MAKSKVVFICQSCGASFPQWAGQCGDCQAWNSLTEERAIAVSGKAGRQQAGYAAAAGAEIVPMASVTATTEARVPTGLAELDHVLGGGLVTGAVVLIGGDPGIGKSTLLLQTLVTLSKQCKALYITGEESVQQVSLRAQRLGLAASSLLLLTETHVERILAKAHQQQPHVMVIDSIQTVFSDHVTSAAGSVSQVRECAQQLVQYAKQQSCCLFLVGHVTKEGMLAGPRVLEHMVDTVLYFEGQRDNRMRLLRAVKNRFGAVNELGVFAMTDKGLRGVTNPSAIFLNRSDSKVPGSSILVTWEGTRPLLVEVQALVDDSHLANPRRVTVGFEQNRLAMLLAVLHRHGGVASFQQDVFVNAVGGIKVSETAADLALVLAIVSSLKNKPLPEKLVVFGEVGLAGEIRPVQCGQERLREAEKLGFTHAIIPKANAPKEMNKINMKVSPVQHLSDALSQFHEW